MNNTRQIKTFIGAMIAAAVITGGYAGLVSHALHARTLPWLFWYWRR